MNLLVNDRVNGMRYVLPPTEVHTLYSLTTFYVSCLGFFQKNFLPVKAGGGSLRA